MDNLELIHYLKEESKSIQYPIYDNKMVKIGYFVPLTQSLAINDEVATKVTQWRTENADKFQTVFHSTTERTKKWLSESVLDDKTRLFFLVYSKDNELIGHFGLKDISESSATSDNLMIGDINYRGPNGFYYLIANIKFGFEYLKLDTITATVLESNKVALWMGKRLGFEIVKKVPLVKKYSDSGDLFLVEKESATEYSEINVHTIIKRDNFRY